MAKLNWVRCIYADAWHNAFTDMAFWHGQYYVTFRSGIAHVSPEGRILVMRSSDLQSWQVCGALTTEGDDRDPKFCATDANLYVIFGSWHDSWHRPPHGEEPARELASFYSESTDGVRWSYPRQMYGTGYWLWRLYRHGGRFYSAAYHTPAGGLPGTRGVQLLRGDRLDEWDCLSTVMTEHGPNETALLFDGNRVTAVIRTESRGGRSPSWLATSEEPFASWRKQPLGYTCHAPVILRHGAELYLAGRAFRDELPAPYHHGDFETVTTLFRVVAGNAEPVLTLPSGGDTSYCGMVQGPEGDLLISYYSQHETIGKWPEGSSVTPARIYLASVSV